MITLYFLKAALCLAALYVPYLLFLQHETFFRFNHVLLICIMLMSAALPCFDVHALAWADTTLHTWLQGSIEIGPLQVAATGGAVSAAAPDATTAGSLWLQLSDATLLAGAIAVLTTKALQFWQLRRDIRRSTLWTEDRDGMRIYCHAGDVKPFSWMHAVVISEPDYQQHGREILTHELCHVRARHSWDILLLSIFQALQWANPLAWLLGQSLRGVHEYEADDAVLHSGCRLRDYQLLLVRKSVDTPNLHLANAFNHSLLTKRIKMMMRQPSHPWLRAKALYACLVAIVALSAFATPRTSSAAIGSTPDARQSTTPAAPSRSATAAATIQADSITLPSYPGGQEMMMQFLKDHLTYPASAEALGVEGRILVEFTVGEDGSISEVTPKPESSTTAAATSASLAQQKGISKDEAQQQIDEARRALKDEAVRVVRSMGKWIPARDAAGAYVRTKFALPILFRLK